MKNIWKIFRHDLQQVKGNYAAIIIVVALAILPSLYAWFNIVASWDPYGNTDQIQVAVVNEDTGTQLQAKTYLLGEDILAELATNTQMDWQFVSAQEAETGLNSGEYYASITIPADFSADILSITSTSAQQASIIYTSNQKINAIAPKITDKGASALQEQINQTVIATISEVVLETAKETGFQLDAQVPKLDEAQTTLTDVQSKVTSITETLNSGETTVQEIKPLLVDLQAELPAIETLLNDAITFTTTVTNFSTELTSFFEQLNPEISANLALIQELTSGVSNKIAAIDEYINDPEQVDQVITSLKNVQAELATAQTFVNSLQTLVTQLQTNYPNLALGEVIAQLTQLSTQLDAGISAIDQVQSQVANGTTVTQTLIDELTTITASIASTSATIADFVPNQLFPALESIQSQLQTLTQNIQTELEKVKAEIPAIAQAVDSSIATLDSAQLTIDEVQTILPEVDQLLSDVIATIQKVETSEAFDILQAILDLDIQQNVDFLEQPAVIENQVVYPIDNYGSAMTPFYTTLSLWVGSLLLVSMFTVKTSSVGEYKPYEIFLGKYGIFFLIALAQALIVTAGDIWLLDVQMANIPLFIATGLFSSFVFSFFVYSCVSVFGATGKVIGIILLVLQVAGSGGTFPIQLTPDFFQNLYPWLPFTYAISAMRETIGGIVWPVIIKDFIFLGSYFVGTLAFALALKKPLNKMSEPFAKKFHDSGLGE